MRKHKHHIRYKCHGGDDTQDNLQELGFVEHAKLHAEDFLKGGPQFDFRHEGWPLLEESLTERVLEEHAKRQREKFLDGFAVSVGSKGGSSTGGKSIAESNKVIHKEKDSLGRSKEAVVAGRKGGEATCKEKNEEGKSIHAVNLGLEHGWKGGAKTKEKRSLRTVCIETGVEYPSASEASRVTGIHQSSICRSCRKGCKAGGFTWAYL
jgi:hypothetical protein